jgi:phosphoenolpyruvate phosphomutase
MKNIKKVYVGFAVDIIHQGHINILKIAHSYGRVTVGLLTDKAIASYKNIPYLDYKNRKKIVESIQYVDSVIPQKTLDYVPNLNSIKPDYVVHGDDWKIGVQKKTRDSVIKTLKKWSGKLIEPKYTKKISSTIIKSKIHKINRLSKKNKSKLNRKNDLLKLNKILNSYDLHQFPNMPLRKIIKLIKND